MLRPPGALPSSPLANQGIPGFRPICFYLGHEVFSSGLAQNFMAAFALLNMS